MARWQADGVQNLPQYAFFNDFLRVARESAMAQLQGRLPAPRFIVCQEKGSQARFLMAKLNPSISHATTPQKDRSAPTGMAAVAGAAGSPEEDEPPVFSDDTTLKAFLSQLRSVVIQRKQVL